MVASLLITWEKHEFRRSLSSLLITWEKREFRRSLFNEAGAKGLNYIIWVTKKCWHEQVRSLLLYKLQLKPNSFLQFHFNWIFSISLEIYFCRCQITSSSRTHPCQPPPCPLLNSLLHLSKLWHMINYATCNEALGRQIPRRKKRIFPMTLYVAFIIKLGYNTYCHWLKERALWEYRA